jgi:hypothetical protein
MRLFNKEKCKAIGEELAKLSTAGFIKEVQNSDWISTQFLYQKR